MANTPLAKPLPFRSWGFRPQILCPLIGIGLVLVQFSALALERLAPRGSLPMYFGERVAAGTLAATWINVLYGFMGLAISRANPHGRNESGAMAVAIVTTFIICLNQPWIIE